MTNFIRTILVDDEEPSRRNLRLALQDHPQWQVMGECTSVSHAREFLRADDSIDVIFLDIQMPQESGMNLAREVASMVNPPCIVFVTAYQHYAVQAFEFHAIDYLLKPFDDTRLAQTLSRAEELLKLRKLGSSYKDVLEAFVKGNPLSKESRDPHLERICVRSVGQLEVVMVRDIEWIMTSGNYVELHLRTRVVLHRSTFGDLFKRLDPDLFLQVHRRAAVRRSLCQTLMVVGDGMYQLGLVGGGQVPVSERYVDKVRKLLVDGPPS